MNKLFIDNESYNIEEETISLSHKSSVKFT